jgi:hypothetical protein
MVKSVGILILLSILIPLYSAPPPRFDQDRATNELMQPGELTDPLNKFMKIKPEQQQAVFNEHQIKLPPHILIDQLKDQNEDTKRDIFKRGETTLTRELIVEQYLQALGKEDQKKALEAFLRTIEPTQRQKLIDGLIEAPTIAKLLESPGSDQCGKVSKYINPFYVGALPVVDWLNTAHLNSFFQPNMTNALVNRDPFNEFNTFNQWGLWVEPFGFSTHFQRDVHPLQFHLSSLGLSLGGEVKLFERLILGIGAAYSHSNVEWDKKSETIPNVMNDIDWKTTHKISATSNTLYLGPYLGYVFSHGYISGSLLGAGNFYNVDRKDTLLTQTNDFSTSKTAYQSTIDITTWDLLARLEGGLSYSPDNRFYFYPTAKVDYLNVLEQKTTDTLKSSDDELEISIGSLHDSFLSSKVGLKITREFFNIQRGFLIPSFSAGWLYFTPVSTGTYNYKIDDCEADEKVKIGAWNQYYIGAGFTIIHKRGILLSLDYELTLGANSPVQAGSMRFELSW